MPNHILYDDASVRINLLPLTFTRPVADIRCGIWTLAEKWAHFLGAKPSFLTEPYLQSKFPLVTTDDNLFLNGAVCYGFARRGGSVARAWGGTCM
jgi:UDP-N-acetylglucosamine diphosphorylase / glucose-1-phosphate thymidylyltransferase / UDP-N-acetylgalactosamine diphosphorylase / glucosamine-1-phosphate N-acetyltransferase / galactosamine-1-phosphate N-acetyltransferase